VSANESALSLTVTTDGSVSGLTRLLGTLERAKIEIAEFAQKAPSLDDVFLKVISDKEKK
jgi:ABC-2 type transport system ATP-binding protein